MQTGCRAGRATCISSAAIVLPGAQGLRAAKSQGFKGAISADLVSLVVPKGALLQVRALRTTSPRGNARS